MIMLMLTLIFALTCLWAGETKEIGVLPMIVGGYPIPVEKSPYIAAYFTKVVKPSDEYAYRCGGTILTEQHVLSAAHCYYIPERSCLPTTKLDYVVVGADNPFKNGIVIGVENFIPHPHYNEKTNENDVLVIKLDDKLQFNSRVQPILMADRDQVIPNGARLDVMGYGTKLTINDNANLHMVTVPYVDTKKCQKIFSKDLIKPSMLCAGEYKFRDSAPGDSGGPLVYNNTLVGVVSFSYGCEVPSIYARVSVLREFIDEAIASCNI